MNYNVPILLIVFRRPDTTLKVLECIKKIQPKHLYIACDAPRLNNPKEAEQVAEVKKIIDDIEIPGCEIKKMYNKENRGIDEIADFFEWFFSEVEEGIIFEDDDIIDQDFFYFCANLLEKYRENEKIKYITGSNFVSDTIKSNDTYYFTRLPSFWGFATWKRVWEEVDYELPRKISQKEFDSIIEKNEKEHQNYFKRLYNYFRNGDEIGLDQKLLFNMWDKDGLAIVPTVNLVSNIGVGHIDASSKKILSKISNLPRGHIDKKIKHPNKIEANRVYDKKQMKEIFNVPQSFKSRVSNLISRKLLK